MLLTGAACSTIYASITPWVIREVCGRIGQEAKSENIRYAWLQGRHSFDAAARLSVLAERDLTADASLSGWV